MKVPSVALATLSVVISTVAAAGAGPITFDPTATAGPAGDLQVTTIELAPGNSISVGLNLGTFPGDSFTWLYQTAVASISGVNDAFVNGTGGDYFTAVAGLSLTVADSAVSGDLHSMSFTLDSGAGSNFFSLYQHDQGADALAGSCFAADCNGTLVLSGTVMPDLFLSDLHLRDSDFVHLDQAGGNNWPETATVVGGGDFNFRVLVTYASPDYFEGALPTFLIVSGSQSTPFDAVDPSACFSSDGVSFCSQLGVPSLGSVNGFGPNLMLEADVNAQIIGSLGAEPVPEPATVLSLGLGLLGLLSCAGYRRRRN